MFIIDIQYALGKNDEFVVLELAFVERGYKTVSMGHFSFCAPYPESEISDKNITTNRWAKTYLHHLAWNCGYIPYDQLPEILSSTAVMEASCIYVKGHEKAKFLFKLIGRKIQDLG